MKYFISIAVTALVVGLGVTAYFKGWFPQVSFTKPQAVSVQSTEVATPVNSPAVSSPSAALPAQTPIDESQVLGVAIKNQLIAKHGQDFSATNISVSTIEGGYAKGTASAGGGGGIWFAAKVNGNWILVWDGNGVIMCSDLSSYQSFPKDLIPECWDTVTNSLKSR